jgi:DNA-binding GntR family transcriptional regulator
MGAKDIAATLEAEIRGGRLLPGARLPTHRDLAVHHGVALNTASSAMRLLEVRGLVVGEVGRGSFVRAPGHADTASFRITGLGRESLYKALSAGGNPEFATVMKVARALGVRFHVSAVGEAA